MIEAAEYSVATSASRLRLELYDANGSLEDTILMRLS